MILSIPLMVLMGIGSASVGNGLLGKNWALQWVRAVRKTYTRLANIKFRGTIYELCLGSEMAFVISGGEMKFNV